MTIRRISTVIFLVLSLLPWSATQADCGYIGFARSLHAQGEYYRAITEYKRVLFTCPEESTGVRDEAIIGIGGALYSGEEYSRSAAWLISSIGELDDSVSRTSGLHLLYRSYLAGNEGHRIPRVVEEFGDSSVESRLYIGLSEAQSGRWAEASNVFDDLKSDPLAGARANEFLQVSRKGEIAGWKSPTKAALLGIVPGAGYWYAGHKQTAIASLIVNAVFVGATVQAFDSDQDVLGGFLSVVAVSWYAGNVSGGAQAAGRYNQNLQARLWSQFRF